MKMGHGVDSHILHYTSPRRHLVTFVSLIFRNLLRSKHIDVSYFAAGIVSHIVTGGGMLWEVQSVGRQEMLDDLVSLAWFIIICTDLRSLLCRHG